MQSHRGTLSRDIIKSDITGCGFLQFAVRILLLNISCNMQQVSPRKDYVDDHRHYKPLKIVTIN